VKRFQHENPTELDRYDNFEEEEDANEETAIDDTAELFKFTGKKLLENVLFYVMVMFVPYPSLL